MKEVLREHEKGLPAFSHSAGRTEERQRLIQRDEQPREDLLILFGSRGAEVSVAQPPLQALPASSLIEVEREGTPCPFVECPCGWTTTTAHPHSTPLRPAPLNPLTPRYSPAAAPGLLVQSGPYLPPSLLLTLSSFSRAYSS